MGPEFITSEIDKERQQREIPANENLIARIRGGYGQAALEDLVFFAQPGDFQSQMDELANQLKTEFAGAGKDLRIAYLHFLADLSLALCSFLPRWNLQKAERHGKVALSDNQVQQAAEVARDLAVELSSGSPDATSSLLCVWREQTTSRFEAEKARDPASEAARIVGDSIAEYLDNVRTELDQSNLRRVAEMWAQGRTRTELGNDYAMFLQYAMYVGASFVTTNPVLAVMAWDTDPVRWDQVVDGIIAVNPDADDDDLARLVTMEVVLDNMRPLRPIFLLTQGQAGYVCLQVNPRENGDADAMISYALTTYEGFRAKLDGGIPNVVFKLPGTKAGLEACSALTKKGIGCTITVNFGMFQHLPFAQAINEGQALVSYLVEMNGRLAYPVRDELLEKLDELATYGIDEAKAREAAAWAGVAVLKRLQKLLTERGYDLARVKPLVASLRIYEGNGYDNLPSSHPDVTEVLGTSIITVFPDIRRAFDQIQNIELGPQQVDKEVTDEVLEVLSHSEIFKQAYFVADRGWMIEDDERFRPMYELTLEDEAGTLSWAPIHNTLTQFIGSYDELVARILKRKQLLTA